MKHWISTGFVAGCLLAGTAFAELNAVDQQYVEQLIKGGPGTQRQVAENMYNTAYRNTEVLDVMAEVVLEKYPMAGEQFTYVDSVAWMCRALGASGNVRYRPVLEKVSDDKSVHRKLRAHCEKASKQLPKKGTESPYVAGTVNLEALRNPPPPPAPAPEPANAKGKKNAKNAKPAPAPAAVPVASAAPAAAEPAARSVDLSQVQVGMSQQQVDALLGPPTAQTQRMTGKQWQPFNFGARDLQRMMYLYKGVGRVEFSLKSAYEGVFRVVAVTPDPNETGYP